MAVRPFRTLTLAALAAVGVVAVGWAPAAASSTRASAAPESVSARVSPQGHQQIDGLGVAGAWWPADLAKFPAAVQSQLEQLIFSPSGLDVTQYRYLIGSGGVGIVPSFAFKTAPSFLTPSRTYDWSADAAGLTFLEAAVRYQVPDILAFVNAAPAALNANGQSCATTLTPAEAGPYASFLTLVLGHLTAADHVPVNFISPFNEPSYGQPQCQQEAMWVYPPAQSLVISYLSKDLAAAHLSIGIVADEAVSSVGLRYDVAHWLPGTLSKVAVLADHNYDWPSPATLGQLQSLNSRLWATEICCHNASPSGFGNLYDPTISSGIWLAQSIYNDLVYGGYSAFDWWLAASPHLGCDPQKSATCATQVNQAGYNDGLVYYDSSYATDHNYRLYLTKRYWVMRAFSRYVRPGAVLHRVAGMPGDTEAVSFVSGSQVVTVAINRSKDPVTLNLAPPSGSWAPNATAVQTDAAVSNATVPATVGSGGGELTAALPPTSVTTLVANLAPTH
jgi:O-glycosyl hydrolase